MAATSKLREGDIVSRIKTGRRALAWSIFVALAGVSAAALAQDESAKPQTPDGGESITTLGATVVTAQKREEALQDVPITMEVVPKQLLKDAGIHDIKDLQILVPGLSVTSTGNEAQTTARIRGVGTVGDNPGLESSVGVVIDGVYRPRTGVGFSDLGQLERIEVLKGPQGTVFGKNTSAGLINIVTQAPTNERSTEAEVTVGNYGAVGVSASYNDRIGENSAFRIYAATRERDGFTDVNTGVGPRTRNDDSDQNFDSVRGQLMLRPSDTVDVRIIADYTHRDENCCVGVTTFRGPSAAIVNALSNGQGVIDVADPEQRLAFANRDTNQDIKDKGVSAEVNWLTSWLGDATLTSITSLRGWDAISGTDIDYSGADILYRAGTDDAGSVKFDTFSQELRLTGATQRMDWMFGFYYGDEDLKRNESVTMGSAYEPYLSIALINNVASLFPAGLIDLSNPAAFLSEAAGQPFGTIFNGQGSLDRYKQNAKSLALFTNETFHATDALDLTVGLRYTNEDKSLDSVYSNPNGSTACGAALGNPTQVGAALAARGVPAAYIASVVPTLIGYMCLPWSNVLHDGRITSQDRSESEWSGTFKASYRWNESFMTFFSAARGYKAGGFNLDRVQSATGFSADGAGITPVDDTSFPGEFVNSYELGMKSTLMDGNLLLNASLFHSKFTDFQLNSFLGTSYVVRSIPTLTNKGVDMDLIWQTGVEGLQVQAGLTYLDSRYGNDPLPDAGLVLVPGNRGGFAPKWQTSAAVTYEWGFSDSLIGRFNLSAKHTTEYNTGSDLDPEKLQDPYTLVNARVGIGSRNGRWMFELWAQNLTDETYQQVGFDAPLQTGSWNAFIGAPRTYGATLRMKF
ncbi:MAG: TonB-dependent receptor [Xanthomonadales bacterium]|nr:TonB-dependent receptor [Xanthomonadales bacterium]MCB1573248.1 TonB-dependent receptor [Xanthomonadales bacterium]